MMFVRDLQGQNKWYIYMKLDQEEFSNDAHTDKHAKVTVLAPNVVRQLSVVD
jgi:hypothetical protein